MIDIKLLPYFLQRILIKRIVKKNEGRTYRVDPMSITCLICMGRSWNKGDIFNKFCIRCGYHLDIARDLFVEKKNRYNG